MKPPAKRSMCILWVLIIVTGVLLISWDAEAADISDIKQFFKGCSVEPAVPKRFFDRINGECLGHSFEQQYDKDCSVQRIAITTNSARWVVKSCVFDGTLTPLISFNEQTGKLVEIMDVKKDNMVREVQTSGRYKGCTISHPADNSLQRVINGACAGHVFENPPIGGPHEEKHVCRLQDLPGQIFIGDCIIDGRHRRGATTLTDGDSGSQVVIEPGHSYTDEVELAQKSKRVFAGIILGTKWRWQAFNDCLDPAWPSHNSIPFCSFFAKEDEQSRPGSSWTTCVLIDENKFDTSWLAFPEPSLSSTQAHGLPALIADESVAKGEQCIVYISILADGTVGKVSMRTKVQSDVLHLLLEKYGASSSSNMDFYQWKLPQVTVSYLSTGHLVKNGNGFLEISLPGVATSITSKNSKPSF